MTNRGQATKSEIVDRATRLARVVGLEGVTIGQLALDLGLSKSGLFAHFGSKEALQLAILDHEAARFVDAVIRPALSRPRGAARLTTLLDRWLGWAFDEPDAGGCLFVAASVELDDRPGPVRDRLTAHTRDLLESMAQMVRSGQADGKFRTDADPEQVAFEIHGFVLAAHDLVRLCGDDRGVDRARVAFARLLGSIAAP
ncbi:MAG: TetR/AcrR family transcriptional regulator [Myxococcota bacterium]